jgi:hypothetical protein
LFTTAIRSSIDDWSITKMTRLVFRKIPAADCGLQARKKN